MGPSSKIRTFWLVAPLVVALTMLYADRRDLGARRQEYLDSKERVLRGHEQCDELQKDLDAVRQHVEDLANDPSKIEEVIRRTKNLVREGEKVYRIQKAPGGSKGGKEGAEPLADSLAPS